MPLYYSTMLLLFALFLLPPAAAHTLSRQEEVTTLLPASAQNFLRRHFATLRVQQVTCDRGFLRKAYIVRLAGGGNVTFDARGNWTHLEGQRHALPASTIPSKIWHYVRLHYPSFIISSLNRSEGGYQTLLRGVKQDQAIDVHFNRRYEVVRVDEVPRP